MNLNQFLNHCWLLSSTYSFRIVKLNVKPFELFASYTPKLSPIQRNRSIIFDIIFKQSYIIFKNKLLGLGTELNISYYISLFFLLATYSSGVALKTFFSFLVLHHCFYFFKFFIFITKNRTKCYWSIKRGKILITINHFNAFISIIISK